MARKVDILNSLAALKPELVEQWDYEANGTLKPSDVTIGSHIEVAWIGKCGHHWRAVIKDRVRGYGCPICAGKRVIPGINDLEHVFPDLAKEWDYLKNNKLSPTEITSKSHKKVWWICPNNHSYQATVSDRAVGRGCPFCGRKIVIKGKTDLESGSSFLASEWDIRKNNNIRPDEVFRNSHRKVWWKCTLCGYEWEATVDSRTRGNGCPRCSKRLQTSFPEQAIFFYIKKVYQDAVNGYREPFNRVMELDIFIPSIKTGIEYDGSHWHNGEEAQKREKEKYDICKGEGIHLIRIKENPEHANSPNCDVIIICKPYLDDTIKELANYIQIMVDVNTERDRADIYAMFVSGMKENSLALKYPEYAAEWHPTKNGMLTPDMFSGRTDKVFWWRCSKGHDYQSSIAQRTSGSGCPYCAHRKILPSFNDLASTHKDSFLLQEWDYAKNQKIGLDPSLVMAGSKKKAYWKCSKGHTWEAKIQERVRGMGCPVCSSHSVQAGINDFASEHPDLAKEWHPFKNGSLLPTEVAPSSNKKVWWMCSKGHEWQAFVESRHKGNGCPFCNNRKVLSGYNDLANVNPELSMEWHPYKNGSLKPSMITAGSDKKVWWMCSKGHEWQATVKDRNQKSGCPYCRGKKAIHGETDLETCYPEIAKQWNYRLNGEARPSDYLPKSNKKMWWLCKLGHEWQATIASRTAGAGCPFCAKQGRTHLTEKNNDNLGSHWAASREG